MQWLNENGQPVEGRIYHYSLGGRVSKGDEEEMKFELALAKLQLPRNAKDAQRLSLAVNCLNLTHESWCLFNGSGATGAKLEDTPYLEQIQNNIFAQQEDTAPYQFVVSKGPSADGDKGQASEIRQALQLLLAAKIDFSVEKKEDAVESATRRGKGKGNDSASNALMFPAVDVLRFSSSETVAIDQQPNQDESDASCGTFTTLRPSRLLCMKGFYPEGAREEDPPIYFEATPRTPCRRMRVGWAAKRHVVPAEEPLQFSVNVLEEAGGVGTLVMRGPEWYEGDQDGGKGSLGRVLGYLDSALTHEH